MPGKFTFVPSTLKTSFEEKVLTSISNEWYNFRINMQRSLVKHLRFTDSAMVYTFGSERIELFGKTYRVSSMTDLLRLCIFGDNLKKLKKVEIILKTT